MSSQEKHLYEFGPFRLDPLKRRLLREEEPIPLTPKAFDTLLALVEQSGRTIEKDDLMKKVWPDAIVEENNLTQNITALRKSLGDSRHDSHYIATIPGLGYRFVADVKRVAVPGVPQAQAVIEEVQTETKLLERTTQEQERITQEQALVSQQSKERVTSAAVDTLAIPRTRPWRVLRFALLGLALLGLAAVVYAFFGKRTPQGTITSIAVLPLENLSQDPEQEYFADGMTDTLIGDLAKISQLRVISRTSSMHYKRTKKSLPEIARELKVDAVVEGTVQRIGERVRVRAQLIYAPTDEHLWVETYDRDLRDVFQLQSEIAQTIAREVQIKISPAEKARLTPRQPVNPKAFDNYLQGRYLYWNKRTDENLNKAIDYFQSAIREDSTYALPYAGLADSYNAMGTVQIGLLPPIEARSRAEEAAVKALERDPALAEAHSALGVANHYNWKWSAAEQEFKRAIELNPSYAPAHSAYASYLMSLNRVDESLAAANRSRELDPLSLSIGVQRGFLLENARRYGEAIEQLKSVIAVDANHYQAYWMLCHTFAFNRQFEEAIAAGEKAVAVSNRVPGALGMLGMVYGLAGRKNEATKILNELLELNERRYVTPASVAYVYIGLGDKEKTFVWLEKAFAERSNFIAYLKVVPIVDSLRSEPRFTDLVRRVGLPQ
jgi:TolB-like protein/DNA-binding winged helix-turn-helix (wHTH) protein/Flp pilus assembly protein TadD